MKVKIIEELGLDPLPCGNKWKVNRQFVLEVDGEIITVPVGFITDLTSGKYRLMRVFAPKWGKHGFGSVVHDWLYATKMYDRKKSDKIFNAVMKHYKTKTLQRIVIYYPIVWFGFFAYNKVNEYDKEIQEKYGYES